MTILFTDDVYSAKHHLGVIYDIPESKNEIKSSWIKGCTLFMLRVEDQSIIIDLFKYQDMNIWYNRNPVQRLNLNIPDWNIDDLAEYVLKISGKTRASLLRNGFEDVDFKMELIFINPI